MIYDVLLCIERMMTFVNTVWHHIWRLSDTMKSWIIDWTIKAINGNEKFDWYWNTNPSKITELRKKVYHGCLQAEKKICRHREIVIISRQGDLLWTTLSGVCDYRVTTADETETTLQCSWIFKYIQRIHLPMNMILWTKQNPTRDEHWRSYRMHDVFSFVEIIGTFPMLKLDWLYNRFIT